MPTMMAQSAGIRRLRRELKNRRKSQLPPTGRVVQKFGATPHQSSTLPRCSAPSTNAPRSGAVQKDAAVPPATHSSRCHRSNRSRRRLGTPGAGATTGTPLSCCRRRARLQEGSAGARAHSGRSALLWPPARALSQRGRRLRPPRRRLPRRPQLYRNNVDFPRDDPSRPVRVSRDQVKMMTPSDTSTVSNAAAPRPSNNMGARRPPRPAPVAEKSHKKPRLT
ncbi:hypothetical protein GUJ93_ZPchr0007g4373 [Zizania palustris]|uniref:Uncharacterized protein n=1 Tax=Zizania palustris TaxID=103762 RepID=A0A8J5TDA1_ZIZPA|nr:hypothetical protein GUJ93_ZPchr0007g4373 [Zizania palustris]